jgi:hypothetical protein
MSGRFHFGTHTMMRLLRPLLGPCSVLLTACSAVGTQPMTTTPVTAPPIYVSTARVAVNPAIGLDSAATPVGLAQNVGAHFLTLATGQPTQMHWAGTSPSLLLAVATPELDGPGTDVNLRLDGAQPNSPTVAEGNLDDKVVPTGPSCALPAIALGAPTLQSPHFTLAASEQSPPLGDDATFWTIRAGVLAPAGEAFNEVEVPCRRIGVGTHCQVYLDAKLAGDAGIREGAQALQDEFDSHIYPTDTRVFGAAPTPGLNGDGKVLIVLTPEVSGYGKSSALAYFARRDLALRDLSVPSHLHSNQHEILFIDAATLNAARRIDMFTAVAHEFQHLINFHHKTQLGGLTSGESLWLDEGLAMYASAACGYDITTSRTMYQHVAGYLSRAYKYSLTDWTGNPSAQGYGMDYLFITYLAEQFGQELLKDVVAAPTQGKLGLDAQLRKRGSSFAKAFADFSVALAADSLWPDDGHRFSFQGLHLRTKTPFGELKGPSAIRIGPDGIHLPRRADVAFLFHFKPAVGGTDLVLRSAGGPFAATALVP